MPVAVGNRPPRSVLLPVLGAIVLLAWISLWGLEQSSHGWLLHNHGASHHAPAAVPGWLEAGLFLAGWLLMTVAMMLPTTVPLSMVFQRMVARRPHPGPLQALLLSGFVAAWLAFGLLALALLWGIQYAVSEINALAGREWFLSAGLFVLAGAYQFSPLKYACLDKCRTPVGFVISHWHGRNPWLESLNVGWQHGIFCVGCCWALMLLMFAVGVASLAWMLVLAVIMAIEKNSPWGRRLGRPLGFILLAAGLTLVVYNLAA